MTLPNKAKMTSLLAASLFLGAALAGCVSQDAQASSGELYVKDALTDEAAEVHVTFTKAEALPAQAQTPEWVTVYEGEQTIELLSLSNSTAKAKLADLDLQPGKYSQLRITVTNVTVVDHNGTETELTVFGNVVTVAKDFEMRPDGDNRILLDFDLENGVDMASGQYTPVVGDAQSSQVDTDGDGVVDIDDADDDGDGIEDAEDDDRDGDGQPDLPAQAHGFDKRGLIGLCTAWENSENGRTHGNATNSSAFQWLQNQSAAADMTVEAYCEENAERGPPGDIVALDRADMPEQARQALEDAPRGPPGDRGEDARQDGERGAPDNRSQDARERGNASDRPGNDSGADERGNASADGNQTGNETAGPPDDAGSDGNESQADGNETQADGNESQGGPP